MTATAYYSSPVGLLKIEALESNLIAVRFADVLEDDAHNETFFEGFTTQLYRYFKGEQLQLELMLKPAGTDFQRAVWDQVALIPYGRTKSYEEVAIAMGDRNKIRAVANAIGKNPLPIVIPCHRVVGKNGNLTGYLGGLWRKQHLLELEQLKTQPPLIPLVPTSDGHH